MKVRRFLIGVVLAAVALVSQSLANEPRKALPIAAPPQPSRLHDHGNHVNHIDVWCSLETRCDIQQYVQQMGVCGLYVIKNRTVRVELYHPTDICEGGKNGIDKMYGVASMAKSLTSTLLGQALAERYHLRTRAEFEAIVRRSVGSFLGLRNRMTLAESYSTVSLDHLLLMRSDIQWREGYWPAMLSDSIAFDNQVRTPPRMRSLIGFASRYRPTRHRVARFNYSALDAAMAIAVTRDVSFLPPLKAFEKGVWAMIGAAHSASWNVDIGGDPIGPCCFKARIDDLARFGDFVLHKGQGKGIPAAWFDLATAPLKSRFEGLGDESDAADASCRLGYGYFWWLRKNRSDYFAYGRFGQFIHIYPQDNVVIVQLSAWDTVPVSSHARCIALKTHDAIVQRLDR
ncbi:beta-lactamase/transpeptidase-like protein [Rhizobium etli bv. mimosae str. IE4771]|uniref:Beta-lactamase/transpeptidase-like protein n=1 Tax=Rhizobium etli bv. mimosae str. IE4771 TaxID=1432050 RepID=A0A060I2T6_RHIET|nr:serine hydrolase [Rhizobium sp. IE4771]AIC28102.1 beta-lactamase/transpeptidase-like protein [Rhizobium sp. IE4771]